MGLIDFDAIPGYREACANEQANRNLAVLPLSVPLCGIQVHQLMPRHIVLLGYCHNAFIEGERPPVLEDIVFFLWAVSLEYCLDLKKRDKFIKNWVKQNKDCKPIREIDEYLERAFQDAPPSRQTYGPEYFAPSIYFVDLFGSEYGWTVEQTMGTPLATIYQLLKAIKRRYRPGAIQFNPSDAIKARVLRDQMMPPTGEN